MQNTVATSNWLCVLSPFWFYYVSLSFLLNWHTLFPVLLSDLLWDCLEIYNDLPYGCDVSIHLHLSCMQKAHKCNKGIWAVVVVMYWLNHYILGLFGGYGSDILHTIHLIKYIFKWVPLNIPEYDSKVMQSLIIINQPCSQLQGSISFIFIHWFYDQSL